MKITRNTLRGNTAISKFMSAAGLSKVDQLFENVLSVIDWERGVSISMIWILIAQKDYVFWLYTRTVIHIYVGLRKTDLYLVSLSRDE